MRSILIAGGAGFIGSSVAARVIDKGFKIIIVDPMMFTPSPLFDELDSKKTTFIKCFAYDTRLHQRIAREGGDEVAAVINCAGPARPNYFLRQGQETARNLVRTTETLLEFCRDRGVPYIHASSSEIYGICPNRPVTENYLGRVATLDSRASYAEAKRYCETSISMASKTANLSYVILRLFNVYGPKFSTDDDRLVPNVARAGVSGSALPIFGTGLQQRSYCHVSDVADAFQKALAAVLASTTKLVVNIGNPAPKSVLSIVKLYERITGRRIRLSYESREGNETRFRTPHIGRAADALDWRPQIELEKGLAGTISWFNGTGVGADQCPTLLRKRVS